MTVSEILQRKHVFSQFVKLGTIPEDNISVAVHD